MAIADEYDFELGLTYASQRTDWLTAAGVDIYGPMPEFGTLQGDTEADTYSLIGAWYYSGLRDVGGPRSRAAFLGRTSSLALAYTDGKESVDHDDATFDFGVNVRF